MPPRLTNTEKLLRAITETQWQATVEGLLRYGRWEYYHAPDNMPRTGRSGKTYVQNVRAGWPDLVAFRGDRRVALELKRELGVVSPEQTAWLRRLAHHGFEVGVFRPSHQDLLERVLLKGAPIEALPNDPTPL